MKPKDKFSKERPLLLDPNSDKPEDHLTYDLLGNIRPGEKNDPLAVETIRICHLNRRRLVSFRKDKIVQVRKIVRLIHQARQGNDAAVESGLNQLLQLFTTDSAEYAGAARDVKRLIAEPLEGND
ncbi:MAG: hypothetical protein GY757_01565 [bacterium]|nr:hypothetical protein [bacterium]